MCIASWGHLWDTLLMLMLWPRVTHGRSSLERMWILVLLFPLKASNLSDDAHKLDPTFLGCRNWIELLTAPAWSFQKILLLQHTSANHTVCCGQFGRFKRIGLIIITTILTNPTSRTTSTSYQERIEFKFKFSFEDVQGKSRSLSNNCQITYLSLSLSLLDNAQLVQFRPILQEHIFI